MITHSRLNVLDVVGGGNTAVGSDTSNLSIAKQVYRVLHILVVLFLPYSPSFRNTIRLARRNKIESDVIVAVVVTSQ